MLSALDHDSALSRPPDADFRLSILLSIVMQNSQKNLAILHYVRVERIELSSIAWKAIILPLNYTRLDFNTIRPKTEEQPKTSPAAARFLVSELL